MVQVSLEELFQRVSIAIWFRAMKLLGKYSFEFTKEETMDSVRIETIGRRGVRPLHCLEALSKLRVLALPVLFREGFCAVFPSRRQGKGNFTGDGEYDRKMITDTLHKRHVH